MMELKEIKVDNILANFYQPRAKFDREGIRELSESILSNGLINPITITPDKKRKGKYMIVSGERRWQAHKVANLKTIPCFVKEYSTDGQFMVESLIENLHRENLTPQEASKFARRIMKEEGIISTNKLAERLSIPQVTIHGWFDADEIRKKLPTTIREKVSPTVIYETKGLPEKQRIELIKQAQKDDFGGSKMRQIVSEIKAGERPEPIQLERTANDVILDILSNLHDFKFHVDEFTKKKVNLQDLKQSLAGKAMTTAGLHTKIFRDFVNLLRQRGARPHPLILALMIAKNGNF